MEITGAAMVAGVVGHPVAHSMSPWLHGRWIAAAGLDAAYVPFACAPGGFARLVEGLRGGAIRGLNVTAPFKREALAIADVAEGAAQAGSANLLLFRADGTIEARSTDGHGVVTALARRAPALRPGLAVVLGAGGAGAAASAALARGAWRVTLVNRTVMTAEEIAARSTGVRAATWERLDAAVAAATLLVNALPFAPEVTLHSGLTVFDMTYQPHTTPLLTAAEATGCDIVNGIDMLIAQAEPSFRAFFGIDPPELPGLREAAVARIGQDGR